MCYNCKNPFFCLLLAFTGFVLLWAPGCTTDAEPQANAPQEEAPEPEPLYFEPIGRGIMASLPDTTELVIRDPETWAAYRDSLRPHQPFREVDFTQAMVLLAAIPAPSSGYSIEFESVEVLGDSIMARYTLFQPAYDCMTAPARTVPFQAVLVRRAEGTAGFEQHREDLPCTFR